MSLVLFVAFCVTVAHIKLMICIPCTHACCYCLRSDISVTHLTCTVKYTLTALSNGRQLVLERPGPDRCSSSKPHFHTKCGSETDEKRPGFFFRVLEEESWWWLFAAQLQDFVHCIERQQSVPVHACMSHCTGMLAPGTEQLTALTSVNKLIAGDRRTTQPLCWSWLQPLSQPAVFNWFTSWKSVIYAHVQSLILQLDASCINLRELGYSFNSYVFSYQIQSKTNPQIKSHNVHCKMSFPSS